MGNLEGFYVADTVVSVGDCIQELKNFDVNDIPTILDGYISPIHHLEIDDEHGFGRVIYMVVDDSESDVYFETVGELVSELNKFDEDDFLFVKGTDIVSGTFSFITNGIFDVNSLGEEVLIPCNVSFLTTSHCSCPF